ncbi:MAG: hypothetical protein ACWGQW_01660 [bacterium]
MHRPLLVVLGTLSDRVLDDKLIGKFREFASQRMVIEVVEVYEEFLKEHPGRFHRTRKYVAERRAQHERSMAQVDEFLRTISQ